jgi:Mn-dependent DtxR family transcriptional regulator
MACINPDGKPTESGLKMLQALNSGKSTPEEVSAATDLPLFRVRGGFRDLEGAGLIAAAPAGGYALTENGRRII